MKQLFLFILSFTVLSVGLTWLWLEGGGDLYAEAMQPIARVVNQWFGLRPGSMGRSRFINIVPFLALMLLTPRLSLRKRFGGLTVGLLMLVVSHLVLNAIAVGSGTRQHLPPTAALLCDAMPFLVWFVFARDFVQETLQKAKRHRRAETDSSDDVDPPNEV